MPKIRGVKPELWTDETFVELSPYARLLWIGLWNHACDNGHLQDKSKQIKMRILPTDDVNCADLLREIESQDLIERADGWITIPNLSHHQKPHKRWWATCDKPGCVLPEGTSHAPNNRGTTVAPPKRNRGATADVDCDGDVELMVRVNGPSSAATPAKTSGRKRPSTALPEDFTPNETNRQLAAERNLDLDAVVANFKDWNLAKDGRYADWQRALSTWLRREKAQPAPKAAQRIPHVSEIEQPPDGLSPDEYAQWDWERRQKRAGA